MSDLEFSGVRSPEVLKVGEQVLNVVVDHAVFRRIRDAAVDLVRTMRTLKMPSGILIQADPGMGKTLLLELIWKELQKAYPADPEERSLRCSLESSIDVHGMAGTLMIALGYPSLPNRPKLVNMNQMVESGLLKRRPLALLIDEMQHVCEGNKEITARSITDWIKVRMDTHNFPVICAGTHALERLSVISPQFTSRASANFVIQPFVFDDSWRQLLAGFAMAMKPVIDLGVINASACRPLHVTTGGNMRMLKRILMYACMHAVARGEAMVSMESLAVSLEDVKGQVLQSSNPFRGAK